MNAKKRSIQQDIAEEAVIIFRKSLKNNKNIYFSFSETPQQYDFGTDGCLQVFKLHVHSGEYYQAQVKGSRNLKLLESGLIRFSLDISSAEFLIEEIKEPSVLIVVDNVNEIVYWHDIQTNEQTVNLYKQAKKINQKTFTLYIDPVKKIPDTILEMYEYLNNTNSKIAGKEVLRELKENTLSKSLNALEKYSSEALSVEGYSWKYGTENLNNAVMTIKDGDNVPITYYAKGVIKEENVVKIKFNVKYSGQKDFEKINKALRGEEDFLIIPEESIGSLTIGTDKKKIHDSGMDGKVKVSISPVKYFQKIIIFFESTSEEIEFDTQSWTSNDGSLILESTDFSNNPIRVYAKIIGLKFEIFKINLDKNYIKNLRDLYNNLSFISRAKGNITLYLLQGNKRIKITSGNIKEEGKNLDKILGLLNKLLTIEEKMKISFNFSPDTGLTKEDRFNINVVYQLLEKGECIVDLNVKFGTKLEIKENGFLSTEIENPHFKVLDKNITFDKTLYISGKVDKINEVSKDSNGLLNYKLLISNTVISFNKKFKP